jgi:hypothetical protein
MTIGTPDGPEPVNTEHRARRYFTRTAGIALITPAVILGGIAFASGASAAEPEPSATAGPTVSPNTVSDDPSANPSDSQEPSQEDSTPAEDPTCYWDNRDLSNITYLINGTSFATLEGNVHSGDTVKATFTLGEGCDDQFSLAAYKAASGTYVESETSSQTLADSDTGHFGGGVHTLTVTIPTCFYQVDFVRGPVLTTITPGAYSDAGHLIDHDNGGTTSCMPPTTHTDPPKVLDTTVTVADTADALPFTGGATPLLLAIGSSLVGAGAAMRLAASRRFARRH